METKADNQKMERMKRRCGVSLEVDLEICLGSKNFIHTKVRADEMDCPDFVTFVYGPTDEGDFNDLLYQSEKWGHKPRASRKIALFQEFLDDCELHDLEYKGVEFTWTNKRLNKAHVKEKIDRALGNLSLNFGFPKAQVLVNEAIGSDHASLLVDLCFVDAKTPRAFKFEAVWAEHPDFVKVVGDSWLGQKDLSDRVVSQSVERLNNCRKALVSWSKKAFPNNRKLVENLLSILKDCNEGDLTEEKAILAEEVVRKIEEAWDLEEKYWFQRAKLKWIYEGDKNSKFFHALVVQRRQRNKVVKVKDENGRWVEKEEDIGGCFARFFADLFKRSGPRNFDGVLGYVKPAIGNVENDLLMSKVSREEVKEAVFQLGAMKAPGPDGYSGMFYRKAWGEVGEQVVKVVADYIEKGVGLEELNLTNVVMIPKVDRPEVVGQFRPISLCNFSYKVISKVMTNKMKGLLSKFISGNQRAFVAGRLIQDNIIITHEVFHYLKNKRYGGKRDVAIKMDINKAYDRLEWDFLQEVLLKLGFCEDWVKRIMGCVCLVNFDFQLSGKTVAALKPGRCVRQGDPLSPYLFIIVADVLSAMIEHHVRCGDLKGIKLSRSGPVLSHCFFADDSLFFMRADKENYGLFKKILDDYCLASGQGVNLEKSGLFFSKNTPDDVVDLVCSELDIKVTPDPGKGHKPSWGWSSLLDGRDFLKDGLCWRIGNGSKVKVGKDKWIPPLEGMMLSLPLSYVGDKDALVSDLICDGDWDLSSIACSIAPSELNAILSIPLSPNILEDKLVWTHARNGVYQVKIGYRCEKAVVDKLVDRKPSCSRVIPSKLWKEIWGLKVIPRVKNFIWRVCSDAIPTGEAQVRRGCNVTMFCPICGVKPESTEHMLMLCDWVKKVWFLCPLALRVSEFDTSRFDVWCEQMLVIISSMKDFDKSLWAYLCWGIWKARCDFVFKGVAVNVLKVVILAVIAANEFWDRPSIVGGQDGALKSTPRAFNFDWKVPSEDFLLCFVDGAFDKVGMKGCFGAIFRNLEGKVVGGTSGGFLASSSLICEAFAIRKAVSFAGLKGWSKVLFLSDCEYVVKAIGSGCWAGCDWASNVVLCDIGDGLGKSAGSSVVWINRQASQAADWLAKLALKGEVPKDWVCCPPPLLASFLMMDFMGFGCMGVDRDVKQRKISLPYRSSSTSIDAHIGALLAIAARSRPLSLRIAHPILALTSMTRLASTFTFIIAKGGGTHLNGSDGGARAPLQGGLRAWISFHRAIDFSPI
ncbi:reverse transcriptase [Senna tora]|uniref:Reverse transcriptase n=1 Tax=Senna tora TaxID=362788 RepID=A0A834T033_9FABA|nr:reverse transcriptase [Senna tora]